MKTRTPWIETRQNGSRRIRWTGPDGKRRSRAVSGSLTDARRELRRISAWLRGTGTGSGQTTLTELMRMMDCNFRPHVTAAYWKIIERSMRYLMRFADRLEDVNARALDAMKSELLQRCCPATVNTYMRHCAAALSKALEWELIDRSPFDRRKRMKEPERMIRVLDADAERKLLQGVTDTRDLCMIYLALDGGLRAKEIACLHVFEDIDLGTGEVQIRNREGYITKSKKNRVVFVGESHLRIFRTLVSRARKRQPFVFWNRNAQAVSARFSAIKKRAGVNITLHDLRRTCATRMAEAGVPMHTVRDYLGHQSVTVTEKHYLHVRRESMREARQQTDTKQGGAE